MPKPNYVLIAHLLDAAKSIPLLPNDVSNCPYRINSAACREIIDHPDRPCIIDRANLLNCLSKQISERELKAELDADHEYSLRFNWALFSDNEVISLKFIEDHPELPWRYKSMCWRHDITYEFFMKHLVDARPARYPCIPAWIMTLDEVFKIIDYLFDERPDVWSEFLLSEWKSLPRDKQINLVLHDRVIGLNVDYVVARPDYSWNYSKIMYDMQSTIKLHHLYACEGLRHAYNLHSDVDVVHNVVVPPRSLSLAEVISLNKDYRLKLDMFDIITWMKLDDLMSCVVSMDGKYAHLKVGEHNACVILSSMLSAVRVTEEYLERFKLLSIGTLYSRLCYTDIFADITVPYGDLMIIRDMTSINAVTPVKKLTADGINKAAAFAASVSSRWHWRPTPFEITSMVTLDYDELVAMSKKLGFALEINGVSIANPARGKHIWDNYRRYIMSTTQYSAGMSIMQVVQRHSANGHDAHEALLDELELIG
jgi:hypothetical protein